MKKTIYFFAALSIIVNACQKSASFISQDNGTQGEDLPNAIEDTLTYEIVIPTGKWLAMWNNDEGDLVFSRNTVSQYYDTITGTWAYSFVPKKKPFQMLLSLSPWTHPVPAAVATVNFYKNGQLVKTISKSSDSGHLYMLYDAVTDADEGTIENPVLSYEVLVDAAASLQKGEWDTWVGSWNNSKERRTWTGDSTQGVTVLPSGWKYTFRPEKLPFQMYVEAAAASGWRGTEDSPETTVNFYVNGLLVKTSTSNYGKGETAIWYDVE